MTDSVVVVTDSSTNTIEIIGAGPQGAQGPQGVKGDVGDVNPEMYTLRDQAAASAVNAATSATDANTAKVAAQTAKTGAETAQTGAQTARTGAETAQTAAETAQTAAETAQTAAAASASTATTQASEAATSATTATTKASEAATSASNASASATTATTQAGISTTKAGEAATSATNAATSATNAASSATSASTSVTTATTKASEASAFATNSANSASSATTQAASATSSASAAATSASNASGHSTQAGVQASNAAASAATATTQAGIATTQATNSATSATTSATQAGLAAAGAATSTAKASEAAGSAAAIQATFGNAASVAALAQNAQAAASLAQGYAASASSVVQQDLSGVTAQALHRSPNAITAMTIYDTSKDSDGGAWTKKCQQTSWYNEALAGKWLGPQASETFARYEGATLGSELVTNGSFNSGTTGWSNTGVGTGSLSAAGGKATCTTVNGSNYVVLSQALTTVSGALYKVSFNITRISGSVDYYVQFGSATQNYASGPRTLYLIANSSSVLLTFQTSGNAAGVFEIDDITVKQVTALTTASNDYFQLTSDGKFYRLWKNIFTNSNTFTNYNYPTTPTTFTANSPTVTAPDGTNTATEIIFAGGAGNDFAYRSQAITAGVTFSVWMRTASGTRTVGLRCWANMQVVSCTVTTTWQRFSITLTSNENTAIGFDNRTGLGGAGGAGSIFVANAQLEYGYSATEYEAKTTIGSTSEIFRGNKAEFPKLAAIVAEAGNVNIYDLTEPGRPMWMRFWKPGTDGIANFLSHSSSPVSSINALNGYVAVGQSNGQPFYGHLRIANFAADQMRKYTGYYGTNYVSPVRISQRNDHAVYFSITSDYGSDGPGIGGSGSVSSIAMTVLPDAPMDTSTGLRVPTIAVATSGGVSVIKHNGTVVNSSNTTAANAVVLSPNLLEWGISSSAIQANWLLAKNPGILGASFAGTASNWFKAFVNAETSFYSQVLVPASRLRGRISKVATNSYVSLTAHNVDNTAKNLGAAVTNTFNTGWMTGDIRRAYLSDVTAESISNASLITNGTFDTNTTGWTALQSALSVDTQRLKVANSGAQFGVAWQLLSTVTGKSYRVEVDVTIGTATQAYLRVGLTAAGLQLLDVNRNSSGKLSGIFTAIGTTTYVHVLNTNENNGYNFYDNISVVEVVADRSYRAASAPIFGTLTKSQLASGTSLVGFSGFSASNYLREPYSADLDFGTGEFTATAWVNVPATLPDTSFPNVGSELVTNGDFSSGTTGWNLFQTSGTATITVSSGAATLTNPAGSTYSTAYQGFTTVIGRTYKATGQIISASGADFNALRKSDIISGGSNDVNIYGGNGVLTPGTGSVYFQATATTTYVLAQVNNATNTITFDNVSVREVGPTVIADRAFSSGPRIRLAVNSLGRLTAEAFDGTTTRTVITTAAYNTATWLKARVRYTTDGSLAITVNGREVAVTRGTPLASMTLGKNMISQSESFDLAPWNNSAGGTGVACVVTSNAGNDPNGNPAADRIQFNLGGGTVAADFTRRIQAVNTPATAHVFSIYVKSYDGTSTYSMHIVGPTGATTAIAVTGSWQRFEVTGTGPGSNLSYAIGLRGGQTPTNDNTADVLVWGAQVETGSTATAYAATNVAPLTIGNNFALDAPFPGSIALLKLGATVPTPEQDQFIYEQEKQLFRAGAQSVLPDSGAVLDMAYDDATDRWAAVSGTNESYWTGLVRNSVTPVPAGTYTRIVANSGVELNSRITTNPGVDVSIPAYGLREELVRRAEAASRLGKELATYDYVGGFTGNITTGSTAIASVAGLTYPTSYIGARISGTGIPTNATVVAVSGTTIYISAAATATTSTLSISFFDFILPAGMEAKTVFNAGVQTREGTTGATFSRLYDGFIETIRFAVVPGATALVTIQAQRISQ